MALRTNLLPDGIQQKVRPLNDTKAIANGANAISEGFLFFVAAALILGETYRGSRKKAEQRDRTEESVNQLRDQFERLASTLGVDLEQLERLSAEDEKNPGQDPNSGRYLGGRNGDVTEEADPSLIEARLHLLHERQDQELRSRQLQASVSVLLNLALKNRWVVGQEALELEDILSDRISQHRRSTKQQDQVVHASTTTGTSVANAPPSSDPAADSSPATTMSIVERVALERAKALAREVREHPPRSQSTQPSLADLLARNDQSAPT